jgi:hypothetical protein
MPHPAARRQVDDAMEKPLPGYAPHDVLGKWLTKADHGFDHAMRNQQSQQPSSAVTETLDIPLRFSMVVPLVMLCSFFRKANRIIWEQTRMWSTVMAGIGWQAPARIA